jgi:hypothetical protein
MKAGYSHVTFVLDNSGSMAALREQTIAGYNDFLAKQKADPGKMTFSLFKFLNAIYTGTSVVPIVKPMIPYPAIPGWANNTSIVGSAGIVNGVWPIPPQILVQCNYDFMDIQKVPELDLSSYECNTGTPLLDAMGFAIQATGDKLAGMAEADRPEKVFFVTLTDGFELDSKTYNKEQITGMIQRQSVEYNWDFVYLGANQDAIAVGSGYGYNRGSSMNFAMDAASVGATYLATSNAMTRAKIDNSKLAFSAGERLAAMTGDISSIK